QHLPTNVSITLLYALHTRLYELVKHITDKEWERTIVHPASNKQMTLWHLLGMYAWHGRHHIAHITSLRERNGW
ncbi:MAG: DinB family protein, partial [Chitinophagaceae bacterium]